MIRDYWNRVEVADEEKVKNDVIALIKKAGTLTYSEMQELRNSAELCDRSHFMASVQRVAERIGEKVPKELEAFLEDPDFDVRVSFMKAVVEAVDPAPAGVRAH